ncbi:putative Zn-dependent protease [Cylindrospermum stagnale PCC 7417]|uniref:Putative Zn-dependent protease n=1 Tax=Cylindrospermum stagnale PCC 7417 TaxID=56107 RepID=K9WZF7_9NOST|nr:Zn-dependent protease [Cylindrospermum stagnale]AFZ25181.1 putative Zn-dependent protease [Cylindrospermum stagnale PCC 7417]
MGKITQHPKSNTQKNLFLQRLLAALVLFIGTGLLVIFTNLQATGILTNSAPERPNPQPPSLLGKGAFVSPPLLGEGLGERSVNIASQQKLHPLPPTLAQWQDKTNSGDYFSQVTSTPVGYLVWSQFPLRVKVEAPKAVNEKQSQAWVNSVLQAVQEWNVYLPLVIVKQPEVADITIVQKAPPLQFSPDGKIPRARSAQTTYEVYINNNLLNHRFTILLSPSQTGEYLLAATRHELGHALGIWGHSQLQTDALYFSQVRKPPSISIRDVNTLKRVYQQPTSLGWSVTDGE